VLVLTAQKSEFTPRPWSVTKELAVIVLVVDGEDVPEGRPVAVNSIWRLLVPAFGPRLASAVRARRVTDKNLADRARTLAQMTASTRFRRLSQLTPSRCFNRRAGGNCVALAKVASRLKSVGTSFRPNLPSTHPMHSMSLDRQTFGHSSLRSM
jgi:hypothetical protein